MDVNEMSAEECKEYIGANVSIGDRLDQLAEEAAEIAQAALKLKRAVEGTNPTPISPDEATIALELELVDLATVLDVCFETGYWAPDADKLRRWVQRLEERK